jgi:polyisoprenoid-binding protein YceI
MGLKTLHGSFHEFAGSIDLTGANPNAEGRVSAASIDTGERVRDEHLRNSADFFDVERHPQITFRSTLLAPVGASRLRVEGDLSMRGTTCPIVLEGTVAGPDGRESGRITLELRGELNRKDFGLTWNQALDTGGALLGNRVKIELELSALT